MGGGEIAEPAGIRQALMLPAAWYSSPYHHERELTRVWATQWVCVGDTLDMPAPGSSRALRVGRTPVVLVHHRDGGLSAVDNSLKPVGLATWRRWVFVQTNATESAPNFGPLGTAIDAFPLEAMEVVLSESDESRFNWKLLVEQHSENFGGEGPYELGSDLIVFPNLILQVFADAALAMWVESLSINRTVVHRRVYARAGADRKAIAANIDAQRRVHTKDVDICSRTQRSHDAGGRPRRCADWGGGARLVLAARAPAGSARYPVTTARRTLQ